MTVELDQPFITAAGDSIDYWSRDALWSVLISGEQTRGDLTMIEQLMPRSNGAPLHVHERLHEYFYVLDGELRFQIGGTASTASSGAAISIPPGTAHGFIVDSDTARVLNLYTPGGFDDRLAWLAKPATAKTLPPAGLHTDDPDQAAQAAFDARLRQLHNERWAEDAVDLFKDERQ